MAAREASASGVELLVIHAYPWPVLYASLANVPYSAKEWTPAPETVRLGEAATAEGWGWWGGRGRGWGRAIRTCRCTYRYAPVQAATCWSRHPRTPHSWCSAPEG